MEIINNWLSHWEPIWLCGILGLELFIGLFTAYILTIEFFYDKEFNEQLKNARREARKKKVENEISLCEGEGR